MGSATHLPSDESGTLQRFDVLGGGCKRHVERFSQLGDGALT